MSIKIPPYSVQNEQTPGDRLNIAANITQFISLFLLLKDASNQEIMEELQKQDKEYLTKIIEQNELIIKQNEELLRRR